jgi:hypothetical protein
MRSFTLTPLTNHMNMTWCLCTETCACSFLCYCFGVNLVQRRNITSLKCLVTYSFSLRICEQLPERLLTILTSGGVESLGSYIT